MIIRKVAALAAAAGLVVVACSSSCDAGAERWRRAESAAAAADCTVGVSWNNYQEERWAKWDEPAIKAALDGRWGQVHLERRQVVRRDPGDATSRT